MQELQLSISDEAFQAAQELAKEQGYASTEGFLNDLVTKSLLEEENFDSLFTPERLAVIKASSDGIKAGDPVYSQEEVLNMIAEKRRAWDEANPQ